MGEGEAIRPRRVDACHCCHVALPNVRVKLAPTVGRAGPAGENVPRTAYRWPGPRGTLLGLGLNEGLDRIEAFDALQSRVPGIPQFRKNLERRKATRFIVFPGLFVLGALAGGSDSLDL